MSTVVIPSNVLALFPGKPITSIPRGLRNNNPGNVRLGDNWQGLASVQSDPSFCQFTDIKYGIRCLASLLRTYNRRYGLRNVTEVITRWAPTTENDTAAYIAAVAATMHMDPHADIDFHNDGEIADMVAAIIKHENGMQPYTSAQLVEGVRLAS